jgi:hypothetical protein
MALITFKFVLGGINDVYYYPPPFSCFENQSIFCLPSDRDKAIFVVGLATADTANWPAGLSATHMSRDLPITDYQQQYSLNFLRFNSRINHFPK